MGFFETGLDALVATLGPVGMARFLQVVRTERPRTRDYTAERHQWLSGLTIDDIVGEIMRQREQSGANER